MTFPDKVLVVRGEFTQATAAGLIYGAEFCKDSVKQFNPELIVDIKFSFGTLRRDAPIYNYITQTDPLENFIIGEVYGISRKSILDDVGNDAVVLLIYNKLHPRGQHLTNITILEFSTEQELSDFLQGFMTMLQAFNIDPTKVFYAPPFRGNTNYMINNIILPPLE